MLGKDVCVWCRSFLLEGLALIAHGCTSALGWVAESHSEFPTCTNNFEVILQTLAEASLEKGSIPAFDRLWEKYDFSPTYEMVERLMQLGNPRLLRLCLRWRELWFHTGPILEEAFRRRSWEMVSILVGSCRNQPYFPAEFIHELCVIAAESTRALEAVIDFQNRVLSRIDLTHIPRDAEIYDALPKLAATIDSLLAPKDDDSDSLS
jgi:hypothetical protein